jgi:hypothetical protein
MATPTQTIHSTLAHTKAAAVFVNSKSPLPRRGRLEGAARSSDGLPSTEQDLAGSIMKEELPLRKMESFVLLVGAPKAGKGAVTPATT